MPIKVYLADRYSLFREGLKYILEKECNVQVVGEYVDDNSLLFDIQLSNPDIVIISCDSLKQIHQIRKESSKVKFVYVEDISSYQVPDLNILIQHIYNGNDILGEMSFVNIELLTTREFQVLKMIAQGLSNKEIANKLSITERTTKNHVSSILKKIHVNDRTQAALFAIKNGIESI